MRRGPSRPRPRRTGCIPFVQIARWNTPKYEDGRAMTFPQEMYPELISYLRMLERKGIKSLYLDESPRDEREPADESGAHVVNGPDDERDAPGARGERHPDAEAKHAVARTEAKHAAASAAAGRPGSIAAAELARLAEEVARCKECPLCKTRTKTVFGVGNRAAAAMFIGEAPGRDEDRTGEPFVGRAGQLLNKILQAIDLRREDVYITNILKCRPPENRDPDESEVRCCEKYLAAQIEIIRPRVICALGRIAARWLLRTDAPLSALRLGDHEYRGIPVLVTYHPAALLRNPNFKRATWEDFKKLKRMLDALE
jgi:uracil-DNA glycosylase family 4